MAFCRRSSCVRFPYITGGQRKRENPCNDFSERAFRSHFPWRAELFRPGAAKRWQGSRVRDPVPTSAIRKSNFLIRISHFPSGKAISDPARRIGIEGVGNLVRERHSRGMNGILAQRIAALDGHAPVVSPETFPALRRRHGREQWLRHCVECIQIRRPACAVCAMQESGRSYSSEATSICATMRTGLSTVSAIIQSLFPWIRRFSDY